MNFPRRCADFSNIYLFLFLLSPQASKSGISSWVRQFLIKYAAKKKTADTTVDLVTSMAEIANGKLYF